MESTAMVEVQMVTNEGVKSIRMTIMQRRAKKTVCWVTGTMDNNWKEDEYFPIGLFLRRLFLFGQGSNRKQVLPDQSTWRNPHRQLDWDGSILQRFLSIPPEFVDDHSTLPEHSRIIFVRLNDLSVS